MTQALLRGDALRGLYRPTADEVAMGWVFGAAGPRADGRKASPRGWASREPAAARAALEHAVLRALDPGPAVVAFSGGRDSSAVLALALHVARREGLAEPAVVTLVSPGDEDAEESDWQQLVLEHLAVRSVERVDVSGGEAAALGPWGRRVLAAVGHPTFPAGAPGGALLASYASGGTLLTGELGDNVLGRRRVTAAAGVWHRRGRVALSDWRTAAADLVAPALTRPGSPGGGGPAGDDLPWLRPAAAARWRRATASEQRATRVHWADDLRAEARRAWWVHGHRTLRAVAAAAGAERHDPFADAGFLDAWALVGGAVGPRSRTVAMRMLVGDLLPEAVLSRRTKASFNGVHFGRTAVEVADAWDGGGVDPDLVDAEALRAEWRRPRPHAASLGLLQQVWLHQQAVA